MTQLSIPGRAALAVARDHGVEFDRPAVLRDLSNMIIHLRPAEVVARVATTTAAARGGALAWLEREVDVARWLAASGAAVVPPAAELPPGPHLREGYAITFWRFVEHDPQGPADARRALAELHDVLAGYRGELPRLDSVMDEAAGLIARVEADDGLPPKPAAALRDAIAEVRPQLAGPEERPLHGDAHAGNLLRTPNGVVWTDFEDVCRGPVDWDLACLGLQAAGRPVPGDPFMRARALQLAAWTAFMAQHHPQLGSRVPARLRAVGIEA